MRKWIKILFSLIFLFSIIVVVIIVGAILFEIEMIWIIIIFEAISLVFCLFLFCSNRRDEVKLSWIVFIVFVPFIGICSYYFFGRKFKYKKIKLEYFEELVEMLYQQNEKDNLKTLNKLETARDTSVKAFRYGCLAHHRNLYKDNQLEVLATGPETWSNILQDIENAQEYVLLTYYIFSYGDLFINLESILLSLLKRKVRVYLIFDYAGSYHKINAKQLNRLKRAGMRYYIYAPSKLPFINRYVNYRNHRKDVVIDGKIGYLGGVNLGDEFINLSDTLGIFHDQQLRLVGPAVKNLELSFCKDWWVASNYREKMTFVEPMVLSTTRKYPSRNDEESNTMMIINNGPDNADSMDKDMLISLFSNAKKRIWFATPYFIPPREIIGALKLAAKTGVDVRLLIPGITDKMFILDITRYKCKELFEAGVKIYELNETFSHSKIGLVDDVSIIGSTNLDYRALYSDQQTLAFIQSEIITAQFEELWEWNFSHSIMWKEYIMAFKSPIYLNFLKLIQILSPIL